MIIDTSILLHIVFRELHWEASLHFLTQQPSLILSAVSLVEAHAVMMSRAQRDPKQDIDALLDVLGVRVIPFDTEQAIIARDAYSQYGKGQGHRARLNFGDVIVYALASSRAEVLAFVGDDFHHTELEIVRLPDAALGG